MLGPTHRENLTRPLVDQSKGKNPNGVDQVIDFLDHYDLTKEDMDNILGLLYEFLSSLLSAMSHSLRAE